MTIHAVSVRSTLLPKRANINPFFNIFDLSISDHPPSGPTQSDIFSIVWYDDILLLSPIVSSTIFSDPDTSCGMLSSHHICGIFSHPHCSSASRAIESNLSFFAGVNMSFWERSERKKTKREIPISTHF